MKAPVLVVRTVSVEKLAAVLDACRARWPDRPILVVTNPARATELRDDPRIHAVVPHDTTDDGFTRPIAYDHPLEAVVVPVANRGGSGYANVLRACRDLDARSWFLASGASTLTGLSRGRWAWKWRSELLLERLVGSPARLWRRLLVRSS
ncbi:hypothetical protein ASA1KI_09470 [Opitutales bacterium ASA1]|uniref:hypothetical protein n=1 Tax=Congregicoccus parvus TaxID=3081749 RepID=UPI002B2E8077|nr:hypothetical protein ASA1KI_09470 [Opitutales bacterium ASA1]